VAEVAVHGAEIGEVIPLARAVADLAVDDQRLSVVLQGLGVTAEVAEDDT